MQCAQRRGIRHDLVHRAPCAGVACLPDKMRWTIFETSTSCDRDRSNCMPSSSDTNPGGNFEESNMRLATERVEIGARGARAARAGAVVKSTSIRVLTSVAHDAIAVTTACPIVSKCGPVRSAAQRRLQHGTCEGERMPQSELKNIGSCKGALEQPPAAHCNIRRTPVHSGGASTQRCWLPHRHETWTILVERPAWLIQDVLACWTRQAQRKRAQESTWLRRSLGCHTAVLQDRKGRRMHAGWMPDAYNICIKLHPRCVYNLLHSMVSKCGLVPSAAGRRL